MKIELRQILLVALIAAVFGGGAGYLGGNFDAEWVKGQAGAQEGQRAPASLGLPTLEEREEQRRDDFVDELRKGSPFGLRPSLDERLKCLEDKMPGGNDPWWAQLPNC